MLPASLCRSAFAPPFRLAACAPSTCTRAKGRVRGLKGHCPCHGLHQFQGAVRAIVPVVLERGILCDHLSIQLEDDMAVLLPGGLLWVVLELHRKALGS